MKIKELIKRNLPVFAIGGLTIFVFLFIILTSQSKTKPTTKLIEIKSDDLIAAHTYFKGGVNAPVVVVEFSDYECPACKMAQSMMNDLSNKYPSTLKWAYRHFPLPQHKNALNAAIAAQASGEQGKFWQYSDILFENQDKQTDQDLLSYADLANLDLTKFKQDISSATFKDIINADLQYGSKIGINSTPTFFLNGKMLEFKTLDDLRSQIENELKKNEMPAANNTIIQSQDSSPNTELLATNQTADTTPTIPQTPDQKVLSQVYDYLDKTFGVIEINFTDKGFEPKNTQATAGQLVKWTNKTDKDVTFVQIIPLFDELKKPFIIKPGETFELRLRLRKSGLWTYRSEGDPSRSSIFLNELNSEIEKLLPENIQ